MDHRIEYLADHPTLVSTLARWHHAEWQYLDANVPLERRAAALARHRRHQVPTTVVALAQDTLLGSASLIAHDMDTRPSLTPWLASVYVAPEYRCHGIGSALVKRVCHEAGEIGFERVYLFTPDRERFYTRLGWTTIERTLYRGYRQVVMAFLLPSPSPANSSRHIRTESRSA